METSIGFAVMLCGFAVIYLIAAKQGCREKNVADEAKENPVSGDTRKTLPQVVVGISPVRLFISEAFLVAILAVMMFSGILRGTVSWQLIGLYAVCIIFGPFVFSLFHTKWIFNDDGIFVKTRWYLLFFTILDKSELRVFWDQVCIVDYQNNPRYGKLFDIMMPNGPMSVLLMYQNVREGLAFIVKNVPAEKFTVDARKKLKKMGIWPDESEK